MIKLEGKRRKDAEDRAVRVNPHTCWFNRRHDHEEKGAQIKATHTSCRSQLASQE